MDDGIQKLIDFQNALRDLSSKTYTKTYELIVESGFHKEPHGVKFLCNEILLACDVFPKKTDEYVEFLAELYKHRDETNNLHLITNYIRPSQTTEINYRFIRKALMLDLLDQSSIKSLLTAEDGYPLIVFAEYIKKVNPNKYNELRAEISRIGEKTFTQVKDWNKMENNNFKILNKYIQTGWFPHTVQYHICIDDLDYLISYVDSHEGHLEDKLKAPKISNKLVNPLLKQATLMELAAFYGSVQCFKYLYNKNVKITDDLLPFLCAGGNLEMISLVRDKNLNFMKGAIKTILFRNNDVFKWIFNNYRHMSYDRNLAMQNACANHNIDVILWLLDFTVDINRPGNATSIIKVDSLPLIKLLIKRGCFFRTPGCLSVAARNGNAEILKFILDSHPNLYDPTKPDENPLFDAVQSGNPECVKLLLNAGIATNVICKEHTLLQVACSFPSLEIVQALADHGAFINDLYSDTLAEPPIVNPEKPICVACRFGYLDIVKFLVSRGAEYDAESEITAKTAIYSPLVSAAMNGHLEIVKYLIEELKVNPGESNFLALRISEEGRHTEVTQYLAKASKLKQKDILQTLITAIRNREVTTVEMLLKNGASPNIGSKKDDITAMHHAAKTTVDIMEKLLEYGGEIDRLDKDGRTPLMIALEHDNYPVVSFLVKKGASLRIGLQRPLRIAVDKYDFDSVELLLASGADPNVADKNGITPLLSVVSREFTRDRDPMISILLNAGADPLVTDKNNMTPLHTLILHNPTVPEIDLLREGMKDINTITASGRPFMHDVMRMDLAGFLYMISCGGKTDVLDVEGSTCLHAAAAFGNIEVMRELMNRGLSPVTKNKLQRSPLFYAVSNKQLSAVVYLQQCGCDINELDVDGNTPAIFLMIDKPQNATKEFIRDLHLLKLQVKKKNKNDQSIKSLAELLGLTEIAQFCAGAEKYE